MEVNNILKTTDRSDHVSIEIEDEDEVLIAAITEEITCKPSSQCFIYKVPKKYQTERDIETFEPRVVSIGPYHHGKVSLIATEVYKRWYLYDLISERTTRNTTLKDFVKAIRKLEVRAREYYAEPVKLTSNEFVKMMVFDGCFILELLYKYIERGISEDEGDENEDKDDKEGSNNKNDPIFGTTWMIYRLRKDLVLLENQIPFIVLQTLFDLAKDHNGGYFLNELVTIFFQPILPSMRPVTTSSFIKGKHILDLLRSHLLPSSRHMKGGNYPEWEYIRSATELRESGVRFRKKGDLADGLLDITFTKDGVLEIPPFFFGESWNILLPNLIALEQSRCDYTDQITSYFIFFDSLINTEDDVKLLRTQGIMEGLINEDEKVADAINNLFKGAVVDKFYYDGLFTRVNAYCRNWKRKKAKMHKWKVSLQRDYFSTPWSVISVFTVFVVLVLTLTQTIFSILSYSP
ncbi:hypothetical protein IFM89_010992 [Coptis chinensis]|uniref:Uncharacterized protein n=1 Tax=Coptis chinensis TaxID=261450 RepID=A0A835M8G2_9MAGN|nr:hypothetical protein IFM89_010992 [Coptis chinensis]